MTNSSYQHGYQIGDTVLAAVGNAGARIPGVIEAYEDGKYQISLSQPWVDDQSQEVQDVWLTPDQLDPSPEEETGGTQALPG